jgi:hypothetical protein
MICIFSLDSLIVEDAGSVNFFSTISLVLFYRKTFLAEKKNFGSKRVDFGPAKF